MAEDAQSRNPAESPGSGDAHPVLPEPSLAAPPGWYPDPADTGRYRWWDGRRWGAPAWPLPPPSPGSPPVQPRKTNGLAIPGVIFGFMARGRIKRSEGRETGNGLAVAGLVIGFVMIALGALAAVSLLVEGTSQDTATATAVPFTETFSDETHRFPSLHGTGMTADAKNGVYDIELSDDAYHESGTWWTSPIDTFGLRFEVTTSGLGSSPGLVLRGDAPDNEYAFDIYTDGTWTLTRDRFEPFRSDDLAGGTDAAIVPDTPISLALYARHAGDATTITVWIGDRELATATDPEGFGGFTEMAFSLFTETPPAHFVIDNVVVSNGPPSSQSGTVTIPIEPTAVARRATGALAADERHLTRP
jgi:hypothetical protein